MLSASTRRRRRSSPTLLARSVRTIRSERRRGPRQLPVAHHHRYLGTKLKWLSGRLLTGWMLVRTQPFPRRRTEETNFVGVVQAASTPASQADDTGSIPVTDTNTWVEALGFGAPCSPCPLRTGLPMSLARLFGSSCRAPRWLIPVRAMVRFHQLLLLAFNRRSPTRKDRLVRLQHDPLISSSLELRVVRRRTALPI